MDYFILFLAALCIAAQFNVNKFYQKNYAGGLRDILFFPFACGAAGVIFSVLTSICLYGKFPRFSVFSFIMAMLLAVITTLSALLGIFVMKYGKMSVYSIFMMLGGMILPYFYGAFFLSETVSAVRIAGFIVLICALPFSAFKQKGKNDGVSEKFYYIFCVLIFFLNGGVSIISKMHSVSSFAVPEANFIVSVNIWQTVISGAVYCIYARFSGKIKEHELPKKSVSEKFYKFLVIFAYVGISVTGFLFQLISAKTVPAIVMFPFVTGGSIILSTVLARIFYGEKLAAPALAGVVISLIGTLLFIF